MQKNVKNVKFTLNKFKHFYTQGYEENICLKFQKIKCYRTPSNVTISQTKYKHQKINLNIYFIFSCIHTPRTSGRTGDCSCPAVSTTLFIPEFSEGHKS